jgi:LPXTG-motif cell wall-anchored protein
VKLKSSLHRTAAVLAGAVIGLTGVVAIAGPASAHTAKVTGESKCVNGDNVVTWTLNNDYQDTSGATVENLQLPPGKDATLVNPAADTPTKNLTLQNGTVLLAGNGQDDPSVTQYTQVVDKADSATISFTARWTDDNYHQDNVTATVNLDQGCTPPTKPCITQDDVLHSSSSLFTHKFDATSEKGAATTWLYLNDDANLCADVKVPVTEVSYYAPKPEFSVPQYLFDKDTNYVSNDHPAAKLYVHTPPCYTQVDAFFGTYDDIIQTITKDGTLYGDKKLGASGLPGSLSKGPRAWYNGGDKSCVTPASTSLPNCDGTQTIKLSNSGKYEETFTVKYGDQVKTVTVAAGGGESVTVPAGAGSATVSAEGMDTQTFNWAAPKDCALPAVTIVNTCKDVTVTVTNPEGVTPAKATVSYGDETKELTVAAGASEKATFAAGSATFATIKLSGIDKELKAALKKLTCTTPVGNNSGGGSLPITGTAGTSIAAGAVALLIAGGVFFFVARRRKVRFTA